MGFPMRANLVGLAIIASPASAWATAGGGEPLDLTRHWAGYTCLFIFVVAYLFVMAEEFFHLRKSKPVMVAAGVIWLLVGMVYAQAGDGHTAQAAVRHFILEFAELFLFLLAAMTFVNTMDERRLFAALRVWLVRRGFSLRKLFWITGGLAFCLSPLIDNLTTSLLMGAVVMSVGSGRAKFVGLACINIVVAANAGGAFSPFGDITTLMVWQKGIVSFGEFFVLFIPSLVNWLVAASLMSLGIEDGHPEPQAYLVKVRPGAWIVAALFGVTIVLAVSFHHFVHLPPVLGMMTGLGLLKIYGYFLKRHIGRLAVDEPDDVFARLNYADDPKPGSTPASGPPLEEDETPAAEPGLRHFDIFQSMERAEWDTLMFFYGVILCVGGLGTLGYLELVSATMYLSWGATSANILVGVLSAVVDNIPVMFAVLAMQPDMSQGQWLLVTLTAGVGGSLLSVGSAAGVALMGQARGVYTFFTHLRWTWAIALGYAASIWVHFFVNAHLF